MSHAIQQTMNSLSGAELSYSLGSLGDCVLGKFAREHKPDSSLDLTRRKGRLLVVSSELSCLSGNAFEDIIDEGVHDGHTLLADTGIGMNLLEHLVDVGAVRFSTLLAALLIAGLLRGFGRGLFARSLGHGGLFVGGVYGPVPVITDAVIIWDVRGKLDRVYILLKRVYKREVCVLCVQYRLRAPPYQKAKLSYNAIIR